MESLLLLEARPCAGESDAEIVAGAWDFARLNRRYARHLKILGGRPGNALGNVAVAKALLRWAAAERAAWLEAVTSDPLLPGRILPSDYLGQPARWPSAKTGGGWKCSGTPAGNCARSNPNSPVQTFVAYATEVRHRRGPEWSATLRVAAASRARKTLDDFDASFRADVLRVTDPRSGARRSRRFNAQ